MSFFRKILSYFSRLLPDRVNDARRILMGYEYEILYNATYHNLGCLSVHNPECLASELFKESFRLGMEGFTKEEQLCWRPVGKAPKPGEDLWIPSWNAYICCWAAQQVLELEGDFVECGVWKGNLSRTVINYTNNLGGKKQKLFWLFDTFDGFVDNVLSEEEKKLHSSNPTMRNFYRNSYDIAKDKFEKFSNVKIIKGMVPDSLSQFTASKVCYLSIDMNCVYPEIEAIKFFWDKLVTGAIVILDDYNWIGHIAQKRAFDEFAAMNGTSVLSLPTGQGIIIKK